MMFFCDVWNLCDWYCDDVFVWRVKFFWLILWWCFCVTCESLCDWYCDDVFVWRVKFLWLIYCVMCESFATDIVTMFLCDMWRFSDVVILWRCCWVCDVWSFCEVVILWRCFWVCDVWRFCEVVIYCDDVSECVTCEGFVKWWYCDDVSECMTCEGFVKGWYSDDVSGWSAKILCLILFRCFCVWRMKDLWLIPVLWRCFCVRVKVLCNAWSSVTIFFFWINFDFGPRGPDCGPTGRNLWLWC